MVCEECDVRPRGVARHWRAYLMQRGGHPSRQEIVFYCPECALREFGPLREHPVPDDDASG